MQQTAIVFIVGRYLDPHSDLTLTQWPTTFLAPHGTQEINFSMQFTRAATKVISAFWFANCVFFRLFNYAYNYTI